MMTSLCGPVLAEQLQATALPNLGFLFSQGSHTTVCLVSWEREWQSHTCSGASLVPAAKPCYKEEVGASPCWGGEVRRQLAIACLPQKRCQTAKQLCWQLPGGYVQLTKPEKP